MARFARWLAVASVAALTLFDLALSHSQTHLGSGSKLFVETVDVSTALSTDYESTRTGLTSNTSANRLFTGEPACLLVPEAIEGTYYVAGELIRSDIREDQPGIDLYMDQQFIDVNTFSPVNELYVDLWHVNASGVYSGVVARTNGNSDDASNIDTTVHRGLSSTDSDGFVSVTTKFPGLYAG
ncbi:hypothetical protein PC111_g23280 [Phytophthora cactorum]|nr:hypothetical protein PC111_g23280 [Phytophthora cactorum]KAG3049083.1 hypothetical protein PC122_g23663 [Phytophthora cactorum]